MHKLLVNRLVKLAQEKVWLGELTIAVDWDVKQQNKQTQVLISKKKYIFLSLKIDFYLANSADPDEMLRNAAFHLGLHSLPKYLFRGLRSPKG